MSDPRDEYGFDPNYTGEDDAPDDRRALEGDEAPAASGPGDGAAALPAADDRGASRAPGVKAFDAARTAEHAAMLANRVRKRHAHLSRRFARE